MYVCLSDFRELSGVEEELLDEGWPGWDTEAAWVDFCIRKEVEQRLTVLRDKRVEKDKSLNLIEHSVCGAGDYEARVAVPNKVQPLRSGLFDQRADLINMIGKRRFSWVRQRNCVCLVTICLKERTDAVEVLFGALTARNK